MKGEIVSVGSDERGNDLFGIATHGQIFPVKADEVLLRSLEPGDHADFITDRASPIDRPPEAHITNPPKTRGVIERDAV